MEGWGCSGRFGGPGGGAPTERETIILAKISEKLHENEEKQECIPVGGVPPACWPYPSMYCLGGGCICLGGTCPEGGVPAWGVYLPKGGVPAQGGVPA